MNDVRVAPLPIVGFQAAFGINHPGRQALVSPASRQMVNRLGRRRRSDGHRAWLRWWLRLGDGTWLACAILPHPRMDQSSGIQQIRIRLSAPCLRRTCSPSMVASPPPSWSTPLPARFQSASIGRTSHFRECPSPCRVHLSTILLERATGVTRAEYSWPRGRVVLRSRSLPGTRSCLLR